MSDTETETTEAPAPSWKIVDEIPPAKRGGTVGVERDTELKQFYRWLTSQPVGTQALFKEGVRSPNYGGDNAAERFPALKMSARQTHEIEAEKRDGSMGMVPVFDLYGTHVDPANRPPKRVRNAQAPEGEANPPSEGLLD